MNLTPLFDYIGINLNSIATFIMAIATLALAYFSWKSIVQSEKQIKNSKIQTDLFLSQHQADIQITQCSFNANKLILELKNSGESIAYDLVVSCAFHITKPLWASKGRAITPKISEPRTIECVLEIEGSRKSFFNFLLKTKDKNILEPGELVIFLNNDVFLNYLPADRVVTFQCEPLFYLKTKKERFWDVPPYVARATTFGDLKTLLVNNGIKEISVIFHLLSKDKLQNVLFHGRICDFIITLTDDGSLEDGYKRGKRGPYPLDKNDIKTRHKWLDYHLYRHGKYMTADEIE